MVVLFCLLFACLSDSCFEVFVQVCLLCVVVVSLSLVLVPLLCLFCFVPF